MRINDKAKLILTEDRKWLSEAVFSPKFVRAVEEEFLPGFEPVEPSLQKRFNITTARIGLCGYYNAYLAALGEPQDYLRDSIMSESILLIRDSLPLTDRHPVSQEDITHTQEQTRRNLQMVVDQLGRREDKEALETLDSLTPDAQADILEAAYVENVLQRFARFVMERLDAAIVDRYEERVPPNERCYNVEKFSEKIRKGGLSKPPGGYQLN